VSVCDIGAGMNAVMGIQRALFRRERTGEGSGVRVSLFDTAADWMNVPLMHAVYGGRAPERAGLHHPSIAPYGGYETGDGEILAISIQNEREWRRFCEQVLSQPELADDSRFADGKSRVANRTALDEYIKAVFSARSRGELESLLKTAGIAYGAVNSVETFAEHPALRRRSITLPDGETAELAASAVRDTGEVTAATARVPELGEHSAAIRREFAAEPERRRAAR
jgi:crotonobetainyl-CoA:carnitine CoA-transferase CaiB-like acyl-CoA transferase